MWTSWGVQGGQSCKTFLCFDSVKYTHQKNLLEKTTYPDNIAGMWLWEACSKNFITIPCVPVHLGYMFRPVFVRRSVMAFRPCCCEGQSGIVAWLPCGNCMRCSYLVCWPQAFPTVGLFCVMFPYTSVLGVWREGQRVRGIPDAVGYRCSSGFCFTMILRNMPLDLMSL